ncbi:MAG TPA: arginine repressor [Candidatus Baltobacteraceae bacterium]|nr:arginine repressor [Candidatus Baltobacteraceae bacterium]
MKDRRQRAILTLVATRPVHSQDELVALLEAQGFAATQATVSRDIKELGLVKVPIKVNGNGHEDDALFKYVVPNATVNYVSRLHRVIAELAVSIQGSVNLIVIKAPPGSAMMVASAVDEAGWPEILGTLGGDDTVMIVVRSAEEMPVIKQRFLDLKGSSAA